MQNLSSSRAATPIAFVKAIVGAYERLGKSPAHALESAQIAPELLEDPTARISAAQMERISDAAMRELDDEALGWFSRRLPWGSYGMLARASISAPNLGVALKRWCRHHGLLTDDISLQVQTTKDITTISLTEQRDLGAMREFCLVSVLRNLHGVACWLIDSRIPLQGAQFPFAAPAHHQVYAVLFSGATTFEKPQAQIRMDARYLDLPLRRNEAALQQMLEHALPLTVLQYRRDRLLVQRVRQALAMHPEQTRSAHDLAALLYLSPRTLHRQLKDEGASLQQLKDEVRRQRAQDLLLRTDRPIKQVSTASGFQNEKSFMRAFKGWTGQSPAEFRHAAGTTPGSPGG
ncbi:MAG: AraC family transcriptional regulator [Hydrogenophaga sp.]|uniref:AraC family transcriptional regulator n=1 Tax=Rhodoferax sp. TaxID=50421 RepID=UPI002721B00B|nr:AraC family transcriptional regulator [Rhodoferax sp.]MDP3250969.1 AraC family transcriptional regulator [Hydrogenophaga sp.]MDO9143127.1 AraC family transcriptional regulator [Rhodoferax sp.]MDP1528257.1 AraC family transcriptional regulator [Rhodoferax sp.]MDP1945012.1 AraC family transcriptional regulator [Rhodoferax sp.]MDP2443053.1 AraC family transcriptional regulator [Rhodoferax sp.]